MIIKVLYNDKFGVFHEEVIKLVKVTYKKIDGNLVKVWFDDLTSAQNFLSKIILSGIVKGFVKFEVSEEVTEK